MYAAAPANSRTAMNMLILMLPASRAPDMIVKAAGTAVLTRRSHQSAKNGTKKVPMNPPTW